MALFNIISLYQISVNLYSSSIQINCGDRKNGFLLAYGDDEKISPNDDVDTTHEYQHFVWDPTASPPAWVNLVNFSGGKAICGSAGCGTQLLYTAFLQDSTPKWKIIFDKNFLSKNMYTGVFIRNANDYDFNSNIQACKTAACTEHYPP